MTVNLIVMCGLMGEDKEVEAVDSNLREGRLSLKHPENWSPEAIDFLSFTLRAPVQKARFGGFLGANRDTDSSLTSTPTAWALVLTT